MATQKTPAATPMTGSSVTISLGGVQRRMVLTNACLRAVEEQTGRTLYTLSGDPSKLGGATITAVVMAGINAAARQDKTPLVTADEVDDGLDLADLGPIIDTIGVALGRALGLDLPNVLGALRQLGDRALANIGAILLTPPPDTSSPSTEDGSTSEATPNSSGD